MKSDGPVGSTKRVSERADAPRGLEPAAPASAKQSGVVGVPAVSASLVTGLRLLVGELGIGAEVRARVLAADPFAKHWVDTPPEGGWSPVDRYLAVWRAVGTLVGDERLRELGRVRFEHAMDSGSLAPILRSWARTLRHDPDELVKVAPHLWRGISQNLGELRVLSNESGSAHLRFETDHPLLLTCRPWQCVMEGWGLGLVRLIRGEDGPELAARVFVGDTGRLDVLLVWR
jgi:hypothetical protein